jgi:hypothetical protein
MKGLQSAEEKTASVLDQPFAVSQESISERVSKHRLVSTTAD